jgi:hypothetical protein
MQPAWPRDKFHHWIQDFTPTVYGMISQTPDSLHSDWLHFSLISDMTSQGCLYAYVTVYILDQWFPNDVSRRPGVSGRAMRCVAKLKKYI